MRPGWEEIESIFVDDLAFCSKQLAPPDQAGDFVPARELLAPEYLHEVIDRFAAGYPGGDRRAAASFWSQWYFGTLLVPAVAAISLLPNRDLPVGIRELGVELDPGSAKPTAFQLPHVGLESPGPTSAQRFLSLIDGHVEPLIATLVPVGGISARLLWSNAAGYFDWILRHLESAGRAKVIAPAAEILRNPTLPDGRANPLHPPVREIPTEGGICIRRRICCLRYLLPGVNGCGDVCPLPAGRG